jgi:hypothetical protein
VILQIMVSISDDSRGIFYNCNMFMSDAPNCSVTLMDLQASLQL